MDGVDLTHLTPLDRCDRCSAQAWVLAHLAYGALYFCGHHWREHSAKVTATGARIHDHTDMLAAFHGPDREMAGDHA